MFAEKDRRSSKSRRDYFPYEFSPLLEPSETPLLMLAPQNIAVLLASGTVWTESSCGFSDARENAIIPLPPQNLHPTMVLFTPQIPNWLVTVVPSLDPRFTCIEDVLLAILKGLSSYTKPNEWDAIGQESQSLTRLAYRRRCERYGGDASQGVLRIDFLGDDTYLMGIKLRPESCGHGRIVGEMIFTAPPPKFQQPQDALSVSLDRYRQIVLWVEAQERESCLTSYPSLTEGGDSSTYQAAEQDDPFVPTSATTLVTSSV